MANFLPRATAVVALSSMLAAAEPTLRGPLPTPDYEAVATLVRASIGADGVLQPRLVAQVVSSLRADLIPVYLRGVFHEFGRGSVTGIARRPVAEIAGALFLQDFGDEVAEVLLSSPAATLRGAATQVAEIYRIPRTTVDDLMRSMEDMLSRQIPVDMSAVAQGIQAMQGVMSTITEILASAVHSVGGCEIFGLAVGGAAGGAAGAAASGAGPAAAGAVAGVVGGVAGKAAESTCDDAVKAWEAAERDDDGDGERNSVDGDMDGDGDPDLTDPDDDNDGALDEEDEHPRDKDRSITPESEVWFLAARFATVAVQFDAVQMQIRTLIVQVYYPFLPN